MRKLSIFLVLLSSCVAAFAQTEIPRLSGVFQLNIPLHLKDGELAPFYGKVTPKTDYPSCQLRGELWAYNAVADGVRTRQLIVKPNTTYLTCGTQLPNQVFGSFRISATSLGWIPEQSQSQSTDFNLGPTGPVITNVPISSYGYWQTFYEFPRLW